MSQLLGDGALREKEGGRSLRNVLGFGHCHKGPNLLKGELEPAHCLCSSNANGIDYKNNLG